MPADSNSIFSIVLAGGGAERMGGGQKALIPLAGKPLIDHVIQRWQKLLLPERQLAINANLSADQIEEYGYPVFPDRDSDARGPLIGVWSALHWVKSHAPESSHLLILPCDTPFFGDYILDVPVYVCRIHT